MACWNWKMNPDGSATGAVTSRLALARAHPQAGARHQAARRDRPGAEAGAQPVERLRGAGELLLALAPRGLEHSEQARLRRFAHVGEVRELHPEQAQRALGQLVEQLARGRIDALPDVDRQVERLRARQRLEVPVARLERDRAPPQT